MKRSLIIQAICALVVGIFFLEGCAPTKAPRTPLSKPTQVGRVADELYVTSTGQLLTPAGRQVELPGMRPQAVALSPDGKLLVSAGATNKLIVFDAVSGQVLHGLSFSTNRNPQARGAFPPPAAQTNSVETSDGSATSGEATESQPEATTSAASTNNPASTNTVGRGRGLPVGGRGGRGSMDTSGDAQISVAGLVFSPDGTRIYMSNWRGRNSDIRVFEVKEGKVAATQLWPLPKAFGQTNELPAGLTVSADGKRLYVVGNIGNHLYEMDTSNGTILRTWNTGFAPFDVVLAKDKAYVSNLGGRVPNTNDLVAPAGKGTFVRVDPVRAIPYEGTVSIIDLAANTNVAELQVEFHASAMAVSPDKAYVVVANTGSDTLSVIDTKTDKIVEKIWTRQTPADLFGAQPTALAFEPSGKRLFVCNGTQNAVGVIQFEPEDRESKLLGLIPVGWFPAGIQYNAAKKSLCVSNMKGLGALPAYRTNSTRAFKSDDFYGTISLIPVPSTKELTRMTQTALQNMRYPKMVENLQPARPGQPARPVPERIGEPSVFKHVIYVIKENRTYDQVLGDMLEGNGASNLCIYGENITPNFHKIAREFVLLDNTYCAGVISADGHQWTDSGIANEWVERQLTSANASSTWPRSYPAAKRDEDVDALSWASSGFIWDNARAHNVSFRNYGEWMISDANWVDPSAHRGRGGRGGPPPKPNWTEYLNDFLSQSNQTRISSHPGIEGLRHLSNTNYIGWDLNVPDIARASIFIKELKEFEAKGNMPTLSMVFLPNDHTTGTPGGRPSPQAHLADNDLAFGRIVEAVSHSKFWPETCIFCIEDDPQKGWDHVSGYRTTCYIVSPYTKRKQVISTQYNQLSVIHTMLLMAGLPPMNQLDASANAMTDCFMEKPDLTPYTVVTNKVRLAQLNPMPEQIADAQLRQDALVSAKLPLDEPDKAPEDVLNRILWRAAKGTAEPYPEWATAKVEDDDDD
jgi:YVTN family beta-propeller protein